MNIFALTTRGLEPVSARELAELPDVHVTDVTYRRVAATLDEPLDALLGLRTVDDVYVDVATWHQLGRLRTMLPQFVQRSHALDLRDAAAAIRDIRPLGTPPTFSVTASFVGQRNYTNDEIKLHVAEGIETTHRWEYRSDDAEADLNVRVFIEHEIGYVGVRLGQMALHQRPYKQVHRHGSLKPPVAAALIRLAVAAPGELLLDPCCGAGTVVVEAALMGYVAQGGDNDADAVSAAQANAASAGIHAQIEQWDAHYLPLPDASVQRIVSNLPWGRQVVVDEALAVWYARTIGEMQRVVRPDGRIVILTGVPELVVLHGLDVIEQIEISLFGQTPTVFVLGAA